VTEDLPLSEPQSGRSRYPGSRPFSDTADDYARFFGRPEEVEEIYLRVLSVPLVVQFGKSGLGKTSLLQAGLFPRLRKRPFLPVMVRLNDPADTLTRTVARSMQKACTIEGLEYTEGRTEGLWELLLTTTVWRDDLLLAPVLVFDQFEEVFTLRDAAFRSDFAAEIGALASRTAPERLRVRRSGAEQFVAPPNVKIVISLREDYLGAIEEFSTAIPGLFHERLRLGAFTETMARDAIGKPAQLTAGAGEEPYWAPRFSLQTAALNSMIAFLKGSSGVIEPFQLQLLCRHAEKISKGKRGSQDDSVELALADFSGSQDFGSVLKNFYRETLLLLPAGQRKRAEVLCEEGMLNASGHRLMLEEGQIQSEFGITSTTLKTLSTERLLRRELRLDSAFYEISHDRLAESILGSKQFRLPRKVKHGIWAGGLAALFIISGLFWWNRSVEKARQDAEGLLSFLLGEKFLGEVRDTGRSGILEQVRDKTKEYLEIGNRGKTFNRGLALRNAGDLKRTLGSLEESVTLFEQALEAFENSPKDPDAWRASASAHERLGEALADQGQVTRALYHYQAGVKAWRQITTGPGNPAVTTDDCASFADNLLSVAELKSRMGESAQALNDLEDALKIASGLLFGRQKSQEGGQPTTERTEPYPDAKVLEVVSRAALLHAVILNFGEDYEGAAALALEAVRLRPPSISARKNAFVSLAWRGNGRIGTPPRALDDYRRVLAGFEELRRWDPDNRLWQRERAASQLLVSGGIVACHERKTKECPSLEEAEAVNLEAIAALRTLTQLDSTNTSWQSDLGWALQSHAKVLAAQGRHSERLAILEEGAQVYGKSQPEKADAESSAVLGRILQDKSNTLVALGRLSEAKQALQSSMDRFKQLIADHSDAPNYVADLSVARQHEAELLRKAGNSSAADAADRERTGLDKKYATLTRSRGEKARKFADLGTAHVNEGAKLFKGRDYALALREFSTAESAMREYINLRPAASGGYGNLRNIYSWIQLTLKELGKSEEGRMALKASMQAAQIAFLLAPEEREVANKLLEARHDLGVFLRNNSRFSEALAMVQEEVVVAEDLVRGAAQNPHYLWRLGNARCGLGMVGRDLKKAGWVEAIRSGLIGIQKAAEIDQKNSDYPKEVGSWRKYLIEQLEADGFKDEASLEYDLALEAYRKAERISPGDTEVKEAIRELSERMGQRKAQAP
jgi:tetratricopeptide (TPR) repeat protein